MLDQHHADPPLQRLEQQFGGTLLLIAVQAGSRLVNQHHRRVCQHRAHDLQQLLLAIRQRGNVLVPVKGKTGDLHQLIEFPAKIRALLTKEGSNIAHVVTQIRPHLEIILNAGSRVKAGRLEGPSNAHLRAFFSGNIGDILSLEQDLSAVYIIYTGDQVQQCRLAGTVGPDQAADLTGFHHHVDVVCCNDTAKSLIDTFDFQ